MPVNPLNLIQGPATLYAATFGATEPAIATTPSTGWTDLGGTKDGVRLNIADEWADLTVDQIIYKMGRRRTGREVTVATSLAEATLANLAIATSNTAPATNVYTPDDGLAAFSPAYGAILLDGIAPGGFRRRVILRRTLAIESVEMAYTKDGQTVLPVTWSLHWVSPSVAPFRIEDATA